MFRDTARSEGHRSNERDGYSSRRVIECMNVVRNMILARRSSSTYCFSLRDQEVDWRAIKLQLEMALQSLSLHKLCLGTGV